MDIKTMIRDILTDATLPNEMKVLDLAHLFEDVHEEWIETSGTYLTNHRISELEIEISELKEKIDELAANRSKAKKKITQLQSKLKAIPQ